MNKIQKGHTVKSLQNIFNQSEIVILFHNNGVNVPALRQLRKEVKQVQGGCLVTKNSLAHIALKDSMYQKISHLFKGPSVLAYSFSDVISVSKVITNFIKRNQKAQLVGAGMKDSILNIKEIEALASLPSLNELKAKLLSVINAPAVKLMRTLQTPAEQLLRLMILRFKDQDS